MRRLVILLVIAIILIGSGFLSITLSQQAGNGGAAVLRVQTDNPDASVLIATPQKGALFIGFVVILIGSLGAMTTGIMLVIWWLNRQIKTAEKAPAEPFNFAINTTQPHTLGYVVTRNPAVTIGVVLVLVLGAAMTAAVLGLFAPR